jgi:glycosyltransferase involved in cell wall biosynthesis
MKEHLPISLVIPCFNRIKQTKNLFDSLEQSKYRCQIILIDDFSSDNIQQLVNSYRTLEIKYHRNETNKGPAYSRNMGIKLADFDFVAFTDNDCIVTDEWLFEIYNSIKNSKQNIAGVGGKIIAKGNDLISLYFIYHKILDPWFHNGQFLYLVTANSIFKKEALLNVDCFDDTMKIAGGEDPGLCFKLINEGYRFQYNPDAIVIHDFQKGLLNFFKTFYRYGFGCSVQSKKYFKTIPFVNNKNFAGLNEEEE